MGAFEKDILTSNLFLIDLSFIMSYHTPTPFLDPFYPSLRILKFEL